MYRLLCSLSYLYNYVQHIILSHLKSIFKTRIKNDKLLFHYLPLTLLYSSSTLLKKMNDKALILSLSFTV